PVVAPLSFAALAPPLGTMLFACCVIAAGMFFLGRARQDEMPEQKNPAELSAALVFSALYALVLLGVAYARERFGATGLYVIGSLSGLTDMDAITLSTAQLADSGGTDTGTAWRVIMVAAISNFVFK